MANTKITALTADTAPTADDLVVTVNDPGGTPATRKATITNFTKAIPAVVGDSGSGGTKGLVPAPGAGDAAANKFLHADGTFKNPAGSGSIGGSTGATDNALLRADGTGGSTVQASAITVDDNGAITVPEIAAPSTPAAGKVALYAKSDGLLYSKDDAGVESGLAGGGGASINATDNALPKRTNSTTFDDSFLSHEAGNSKTHSTGHIAVSQNTNRVIGFANAGNAIAFGGLAAAGEGALKVVANAAGDPGSILSVFVAPPEPGGNPAPWSSVGMNFRRVLTGNISIGNPGQTGGNGTAIDGYRFVLMLVQDGTGSRTATWGADYNFPGGTTPTLTTAANSVDIFEFICYSDQAYCIGQYLDVK